MIRPSVSQIRTAALSTILAGTLLITPVAAQQPEIGASRVSGAIGAMVATLVIGAGLITFAPEFTEKTTRQVHKKPVDTLLYGIGIGIAIAIGLAVLAITLVGIILAVPLGLLSLVLAAVGYLAVGRAVTDNWGGVLLIAMAMSAVVVGVPVFGGILGLILGSFGLGTSYLYFREDDRS
jgi:hypothetical protein